MSSEDDSREPTRGAERRVGGIDGRPDPAPDEQYCPGCGAVVKRAAVRCPSCGRDLGSSAGTGRGSDAGRPQPRGRYEAGLLGGLVSLFGGAVVPVIGHVAGGLVAGYLRGDDATESATSGAVAGLVGALPIILLFGLFAVLGLLGGAVGGELAVGFGSVVIVGLFVFVFVGGYVVTGVVGGVIGAEITDRTLQ